MSETRLRDTSRTMSQENVEIVRRSFQAFLENDFEEWFASIAPGCKLYPRPEEPGVKECYEGWDEMLAYLINWYSGWKEYTAEPDRFIDAGDWVVVELNEVGIAESGLRVEQLFAHAVKIEDGKGVEWRMFGPVEEAFEALGLPEQKLRGAEYPFSAPRRARP
jgi:ketosteroid isomerase-like protein